ncbi:MAG: hypothetical protein K0S07_1692 [Chlamydiales bacterium]|jgi:hypothetical protein|nr:hypothetical protein [Chlamydiales bacterium]
MRLFTYKKMALYLSLLMPLWTLSAENATSSLLYWQREQNSGLKEGDLLESFLAKIWNETSSEKKPLLNALLKMTAIDPQEVTSFTDLISITQARWLRKPGSERWHIERDEALDAQKADFMVCFKSLGLLEAMPPKRNEYAGFGILGATAETSDLRNRYALQLIQQGVKSPLIHEISGERELKSDEITFMEKKFGRAHLKSEPEMMQALGEVYFSNRNWKLIVGEKEALAARATTADTIRALSKELVRGEEPYLFISNQPYCLYQLFIARHMLLKLGLGDVDVEIAGAADLDANQKPVAVYLDTLARIFFSIGQLKGWH